jgi:hypothetical protein
MLQRGGGERKGFLLLGIISGKRDKEASINFGWQHGRKLKKKRCPPSSSL